MSPTVRDGAAKPAYYERDRGVYDVTSSHDVAHAVVTLDENSDYAVQASSLFELLAEAAIPVFLIKLSPSAVSFAVDATNLPTLRETLTVHSLPAAIRTDLALVSVIAGSMRDLTGVMVMIADGLQAVGARLYAAGDSHNSVQCLIDGAQLRSAERELQTAFGVVVQSA